MELLEAVKMRRSIREYKKDPVPKEVLKEIIAASLRAPSAMNIQPWEITVVAGETLTNLCEENMEMLRSGFMPGSDFGHARPYEGVYKDRQRKLGFALYGHLGIARDDQAKRNEWVMKGFRAFDAPALIVVSADETLDVRLASSDIGGLVQTICLIAHHYGLGTCINGQAVMFPEVFRKVTGLHQSKKIYLCIAIGYPDWDHPANRLVSERESVDTVVTWVGCD